MQAAEYQALSSHMMQSIYRLFILGLKIRSISISNDSSAEKESALIALSQEYEQEHTAVLSTGIPLHQVIAITHMDEDYLFTIHESKTTYQKVDLNHDLDHTITNHSIAVA